MCSATKNFASLSADKSADLQDNRMPSRAIASSTRTATMPGTRVATLDPITFRAGAQSDGHS